MAKIRKSNGGTDRAGKINWVYFPKNLSQQELANPYKAVKKVFKKISPQEYRDYLHEWLHTALYDNAADETVMAGEIIDVYDNIRKLYSAAWLIHQRETNKTLTHQNWGKGSRDEKAEKNTDTEDLTLLRDINPELSKAEELGLEEVKKLIVERIPSVRMIYLIDTHNNPFTYYLVVLIDDKEKRPSMR